MSCFGAIFRDFPAVEPPENPHSIMDRTDYALSNCCVSVSFRCSFSPVLPDVVPAPDSHNGVSLPLVRSLRSGFLHFPAASPCATSPGSISHTGRSFDWNNPSMNYLYHRTFLCLVPYIHKVGFWSKNQKFPRLWKVCYNPYERQENSRREGVNVHERSDYHTGAPLGVTQR